jgi:predicted Rossmann fold nucleotide-binding protein DprA/Smf involved in DNA uptake
MDHTENAYAAMLLTMALSPDREEYARPLSTPEFRRVEALARGSGFGSIGALLDVDISGLVMLLGLTEEEAYRVYTLLHRDVQLTYALGGFMEDRIEVVTQYDAEYPCRLTRTLKEAAPPFLYRCGDGALTDQPAIAVLGISGVRTAPEARRQIEALVDGATRQGYVVITGGEPGVSRLAAGLAAEHGGRLVDILGGGLREHLKNGDIRAMLSEGRASVLSTEHPDALFTVNHAVARNKLLFALADAAFIFNTDGRRGELDALARHACDWIYAWQDYAGNRQLLSRGARPFHDFRDGDFEEMSRHWASSRAQQMDMFDLLG